MSQNHAVIYSNGIADLRRGYTVRRDAPLRIRIPVRSEHTADVISSLNVFGDVRIATPPSFRPANELAGYLSIDTTRSLEHLVTALAGTDVSIVAGEEFRGRLLGLHTEYQGTAGDAIEVRYVTLLTEIGIRKIALRDVLNLHFEDEAIRTEIDKALQRQLATIKPESQVVEFDLTTEQAEAETLVQYAIPAAAWKISYRLRQIGDEAFEFQGFAIVDNNTDEDWIDFRISVVTGEPISFSTDLAHSKSPQRQHVNIVRDVALGAVEVAAAFDDLEDGAMLGEAAAAGAVPMAAPRRKVAARGRRMQAAKAPEAQVQEVGDFCLFEAEETVTIAANRSAAIPVFSTQLGRSRHVLHYKTENHAERPFRAVEFVNETSYALGRGVCSVSDDGVYVGSCILPATKPGEDALLPHALETGVRVRHEIVRTTTDVVGLRFAAGFSYTSHRETVESVYTVGNSRDRSWKLVLDHDHRVSQPEVQCEVIRGSTADSLEAKRIDDGVRLRVELASDEIARVRIVESRVYDSSVQLAGDNFANAGWLADNVIRSDGPLAQDPSIRKCLEIQREIDGVQQEMVTTQQEAESLNRRQERLRQNIAAVGLDERSSQWRSELGSTEQRIVEIEETRLPALSARFSELESRLREALLALTAEWRETS